MNSTTFNRLHTLRMENDAAGFAQDEMRSRFDRLANRHENGTAPRAVSSFQLFQTPPDIAARLVAAVGLLDGQRILEPSAGLGRILDALPRGVQVVAVEMAANIAGELYRQDRAGVSIIQRDFLTVMPSELGEFDGVIMNPPFHMRADIRHILHARKFLKPGGMLAALCLDTHQRETALRPLASTWEKLPAGTFAKEGTHVATVLLTMKGEI
jgi:SAM-dependent methyltransferase